MVFHFYLACLFMAAFLRGEGLGWPASLLGAAVFPLGPFFRHNWELNLTSGFAWAPLVLLCTRALARKPSPARGVALGVAVALAALGPSVLLLYHRRFRAISNSK